MLQIFRVWPTVKEKNEAKLNTTLFSTINTAEDNKIIIIILKEV
jgi:hypothetical protein